MPHGTPDFWGADPKATTYVLQDDAELAARLGSPVNFDRRGDVMDLTTFAQGWGKWQDAGWGPAFASYISTKEPLIGSLCAVFRTGTTAGDGGARSAVLFYPALGGLGVETSFVPVANIQDVGIRVWLFDGALQRQFIAIYKHSTGEVFAWDDTLGWVLLATPGAQREVVGGYVNIKMVVSSLTNRYVRVLFNGNTYSTGALTGSDAASGIAKSMVVTVYATTNVNAAIEVPVGHVIITQNEPV
jgi:hypothetical protein